MLGCIAGARYVGSAGVPEFIRIRMAARNKSHQVNFRLESEAYEWLKIATRYMGKPQGVLVSAAIWAWRRTLPRDTRRNIDRAFHLDSAILAPSHPHRRPDQASLEASPPAAPRHRPRRRRRPH